MFQAEREHVVFYDARCGLCRRSRRFVEWLDPAAPLRWIDVNDRAELARWPRINPEATKTQVFVQDPGGQVHGGYESVLAILAASGSRVRLMLPVMRWRLSRFIGQKVYHWVSTHRHRVSRLLRLE